MKKNNTKEIKSDSSDSSFATGKKNIFDVSKLIAESLGNVLDTFDVDGDWTLCDIGGAFTPTCREMEAVIKTDTIDDFKFSQNTCFEFSNPAYLLYYENLRRDTNIQFFSLELEGNGVFELDIIAQTNTQKTSVVNKIFSLGEEDTPSKYASELIEVNTLISNGSLVVNLRCLSESGFIEKMRWKGYVQTSQINSGERIVAIRTFGNRASIASSLNAIVESVLISNPQVLKRTLFVIYDATGDKVNNMISKHVSNARIIEMQGPNYGGGGNASVLISMILRAGDISEQKISEVILFDDDAHIDAETIIRHDAFITARKNDVVSTSVVYSRQHPTVIQEFGGIWGRFFSSKNHSTTLTSNDDSRLFFPYLVRSSRDIGEVYGAKYIAKYQDVEFSTFIFISFPFDSLSKTGAPLPFFLRNDDAEICLRLRENGCKITVNPNLSAWHDSAHNPIGEFYATLHGLIINAKYGGISRHYFYRIFMQRISCLANVGNLVLLLVYTKVLELYAEGPNWMDSESIYRNYTQIRNLISEVLIKDAIQVPWEVIEVMSNQKRIDIRSIVDSTPIAQTTDNVVFVDTKNDIHYSFKHSELDERVIKLLEQSIDKLHFISENFDKLTTSWSHYVSNFNHDIFWNELLSGNDILVTEIRGFDVIRKKTSHKSDNLQFNEELYSLTKTESEIISSKNDGDLLPKHFNSSNYSRLNPDVAAAGFDPEYHWLNYGRHENREY